MNQLMIHMMSETFDFQEALSYIKSGMKVSLTINDVTRTYFLNDEGEIVCTPKEKDYLTYKVKLFHIDAIMSNDWNLVNE